MLLVTRKIVLDTLTTHKTLTIDTIAKVENLGMVPDKNQLKYLLHQLIIRGHALVLDGATPITYTITTSGIKERNRLLAR